MGTYNKDQRGGRTVSGCPLTLHRRLAAHPLFLHASRARGRPYPPLSHYCPPWGDARAVDTKNKHQPPCGTSPPNAPLTAGRPPWPGARHRTHTPQPTRPAGAPPAPTARAGGLPALRRQRQRQRRPRRWRRRGWRRGGPPPRHRRRGGGCRPSQRPRRGVPTGTPSDRSGSGGADRRGGSDARSGVTDGAVPALAAGWRRAGVCPAGRAGRPQGAVRVPAPLRAPRGGNGRARHSCPATAQRAAALPGPTQAALAAAGRRRRGSAVASTSTGHPSRR